MSEEIQLKRIKRIERKKRTILHLADTCLEIVQGQVADLVLEVVEIHGEG